MTVQEPVTIGLSDGAKEKLRWLAEEKYFRQQVDAYRFAIGLALAQGVDPPEVHKSGTIFNIGSFDPDGALKRSIQAIMGDRLNGIAVYKMAERLAEWGINELVSQAEAGQINFADLLDQAGGGNVSAS
jgi:hypothetical protein